MDGRAGSFGHGLNITFVFSWLYRSQIGVGCSTTLKLPKQRECSANMLCREQQVR